MPKPKPKPLGQRIKRLRQEKGLGLNDLANETGHSVAYLEKIEACEIIPPVALLISLARALEVDSGTFLKEDEAAGRRAEEQAKRTAHYSYQTLTPAAAHKHLKAFAISIPPHTAHEGVGYRHDGEEFIYVLSGEVEVRVGENINHLSPSQTLHFNSAISHHLANVGHEEAKLLVVLYTP